MSGYVYFQLWEPFRRSLIARHNFYVEQARKRLLSQFEHIEVEADAAAEQWIEKNSQYFDPDRHDDGSFYETANEEGIAFYELLTEMRDQTRLSVVAGMYHEWDKQLREWLVKETKHWHRGDELPAQIWKVNFNQMMALLECFGWANPRAPFFKILDACRLVVNVYKHGDGGSLRDLKKRYPEYLDNGYRINGNLQLDRSMLNHNHLFVSEAQLATFSEAIIKFWEDFPSEVTESDRPAPAWFNEAIAKDDAIAGGRIWKQKLGSSPPP